ncbi:MAG TPA: SbmA/BacA-like family transporter, partial [Burkholderiales bacterium]|nr:SbmA/BacA-like family transporter [Burkholderiales bacterium]
MSRQRAKGLTLLATVVGLSLVTVWLEVKFNYWNRDFYNTFENRDQAEFFRQLGMFALLALMWIVTRVYRLYFLQMLQIEWRAWLTDRFLGEWMQDQAHYRMQLLDRGTDNPDQRIAEDLRLFVELTSDLILGLLEAVVLLISFIIILWTLSGSLELFGIS